ncbi:MAG: HNH endonuclease [bacterium]
MSGENHPQWKYGKYYYLPLMKRKKKMICMKCNEKNKKVLVVHHIDRNRKNNELENLIWLCRNCHYLVHQYKEKF